MRERPILFSAPMVRAILAGTKTQTRRALKQAVGPSLSVDMQEETGIAELSWLYGDGPGHEVHERIQFVPCPYGKPGYRLWVRETWLHHSDKPGDYCYRATHEDADFFGQMHGGWKPSIHMPRAASRLSLEITGVRVERLQDISEADAIAEGIERTVTGDGWRRYCDPRQELAGTAPCSSAIESFRTLWEYINGPGSWDANSWAWVVEFRRDSKEGAA
jgi:hypothetical protein